MANFAQLMQNDEGILTRGFLPHDEPLPVIPRFQASSVSLLCHNDDISNAKLTSPVSRHLQWSSDDINAFYHDPSPAAWINSVPVSTETALHRFWNPDLVSDDIGRKMLEHAQCFRHRDPKKRRVLKWGG